MSPNEPAGASDAGAETLDPGQRRRALLWGVALGGGVLALTVGFVILFTLNGLPKDPEEWKRLERLKSSATDSPSSTSPSTP